MIEDQNEPGKNSADWNTYKVENIVAFGQIISPNIAAGLAEV